MGDDDTTSQPYPPFSGYLIDCPKCDAEQVEAEYQRPGTAYPPEIPATLGATGPEWMLRRCAACDYTWPEMCADVDAESTDPRNLSPNDEDIAQQLIGTEAGHHLDGVVWWRRVLHYLGWWP